MRLSNFQISICRRVSPESILITEIVDVSIQNIINYRVVGFNEYKYIHTIKVFWFDENE